MRCADAAGVDAAAKEVDEEEDADDADADVDIIFRGLRRGDRVGAETTVVAVVAASAPEDDDGEIEED